ncbi:hypothetical protein [Streptomyces sp. NRRL B-24572]|uniref:hypothetical protein n=1 Tax=Streptomyces sp. NRRL B-24572 TaxID=1962156 RepID=UPI0015C507CD|nr:hypothetical protein [Streptomyces sp. NRRL B-24572]
MDADPAGRTFAADTTWAGTAATREEPRPRTDITVDLTGPAFPRVYAVSITSP